MKIYFDLDGVLSNIDGTLADFSGRSFRDIVQDRDLRSHLYLTRIRKMGSIEESFASLQTSYLPEMRSLMKKLHGFGHQLEILSSYGTSRLLFGSDHLKMGAKIHAGKIRWLETHYWDLFEEGIIHRFNGVTNCDQKSHYAQTESLLIDDQLENVISFRDAGGLAVHYEIWRHEECVDEILRITKCVG